MANQPKSYRKFLAGSATAALVATAVVPAVAAEEAAASNFSDVPASSSHFDNINKAVEYGLMKGYPDNTFKPDKSLTRSDVVKTLSRYLVDIHGDGDIDNIDLSDVEAFKDVPEDYMDGELYQASLVVKKYEVFTGANGNLNPSNLITRQAMAKVLVNAFDLELLDDAESKVTDNDMADEEFRSYINILSENEVTAVTNFRPKEDTSRAQFASFLVRAYETTMDEMEIPGLEVSYVDSTHLDVTIEGDYPELTKEDFMFNGDLEVMEVELLTDAAADEETTTTTYRLTTSEQEAGMTYNLVGFMGMDIPEADQASVEAPAAPEVTGVSAINSQGLAVDIAAVPVTGAIQVKFSEKVDAESINVNNLRVYKVDGNVPVSIAASNFSLSQDGLTATVDINGAGLDKNTAYKVVVKDCKTVSGEVVSEKTVNFNTSSVAVLTNAYFESVTTDNDNNAPTGVDELNVVFDEKL